MIDRDTDRILRSWFHEDVAPLPSRVLDTVLDGLPAIRQRRSRWAVPGVPALAGRRRTWLQLAVVLALLLVTIGALALAAGGMLAPRPRALTTSDEPLAPGRYVVGPPFLATIGFELPSGWLGVDHEGAWTYLGRASDGDAALVFTTVGALYIDPCHPDRGLQPNLGPSLDELAAGLRALPTVVASEVTRPPIDGRPSVAVTLAAPRTVAGCSSDDGNLPIWGLPESFHLRPGARLRIWAVVAGGERLVIGASDAGPDTAAARELDAIVASLDLDAVPPAQPSHGTSEPAAFEPTVPPLPGSGPLPGGPAAFDVATYRPTGRGRMERLPGRFEAVLDAPGGWFATEGGIASAPGAGPARASVVVTTVGSVYLDPCHWRTGTLGDAPPDLLLDVQGIADALSAWWPPTPDPARTPPGYRPPADAPAAGDPIRVSWLSSGVWELVLNVPTGLDLAACDDGEYRLWLDAEGIPRTAQPGERLLLRIVRVGEAIALFVGADLPAATVLQRRQVDDAIRSMTLHGPLAP